MATFLGFLEYAAGALAQALYALLLPALFFGALALLVRGREALEAARRAGHELRINVQLHFFDALFVMPFTALLAVGIREVFNHWNLVVLGDAFWSGLGIYLTLFLAVFLGDFIGYWRHRLEHTPLLWPSHAIHHSDTEMTWLTLARFHPINRLVTTAVDTAFLVALGLPAWAIIANNVVRHYYGYFIHADLPWTYGRLGAVFVSPAMHRWHHARELRYAGTNFATVFSVFDRAFGTHSVPGPCDVPLGVEEDMGRGVGGQLAHPFKVWGRGLAGRLHRARAGRDTPRPADV